MQEALVGLPRFDDDIRREIRGRQLQEDVPSLLNVASWGLNRRHVLYGGLFSPGRFTQQRHREIERRRDLVDLLEGLRILGALSFEVRRDLFAAQATRRGRALPTRSVQAGHLERLVPHAATVRATEEVPAMNIIDVSIAIIIDTVTGNLSRISPKGCRQIDVGRVDPAIDDSDYDRAGGLTPGTPSSSRSRSCQASGASRSGGSTSATTTVGSRVAAGCVRVGSGCGWEGGGTVAQAAKNSAAAARPRRALIRIHVRCKNDRSAWYTARCEKAPLHTAPL